MSDVQCTRCSSEGPALETPPFRGELGEVVLANTCQGCWHEWKGMAVKIINEYRLSLVNPEHQDALMEHIGL